MGNQDKSAILGENFSTATSRLRKNVLFDLLVRHDENKCFRCGERITRPEELSMEHMEPWRTPAQFWDVDNIAFSHLRCNVGAAVGSGSQKRETCDKGHSDFRVYGGQRHCHPCTMERQRDSRLNAHSR
jgi:hypothetical protein